MDSIVANINLELLKAQAQKLYNHQYFEYIITISCLTGAFLLGRLLHERKFTNLLSMINDAESTRKAINRQKNEIEESIKKTERKKYLFLSLLFIVCCAIGAYCYLMKNINIDMLTKVVCAILVIVLLILIHQKSLTWKKKQLQSKLRQSQLTTENQVKQILSQIGPQIAQSLKFKLEREIEQNQRQEERKQCQLSKCANEKRTYKKLYSLYKSIIADMTKFTWCKVCASQANVNAVELRIQDLDANLVLYRKLAADGKFLANTEKSKELINQMLQQWAHLEPKLEYVCKRGCCIKFRQLVDGLKKEHFKAMNDLKNSLRV